MQNNSIAILANNWISELPLYQPGSSGKNVPNASPPIKLSSNENPLGGAQRILDLMSRIKSLDIGRYPDDSYTVLCSALAKHLDVVDSSILVGSGSSDILTMLCRSFLSPGRYALVSSYSFSIFKLAAESIGASVEVVPSKQYNHDLRRIASRITDNVKIIFLDNPCNPTGAYLPHDEVVDFLTEVNGRAIVVMDEAYFEYVTQQDYQTCIRLINRFNNVVVIRTFSKAYGLAGIRLGYCVADPDLIQVLHKVRPPFNLNAIAAHVGVAALEDQDFVNKSCSLIATERDRLSCAMRDRFNLATESVGNFIFFHLGENMAKAVDALHKKRIIIREFPEYSNHIRVTIGLSNENTAFMNTMLATLKD